MKPQHNSSKGTYNSYPSNEGRISHPSLSYGQCGECMRGWLTPMGARLHKRCYCNNGLRLTFKDIPEKLMDRVMRGLR